MAAILGLAVGCWEPTSEVAETPAFLEAGSPVAHLEDQLPPEWVGRLDLSRGLSLDARLDTFDSLVTDVATPRGPSDGGSSTVEPSPGKT